jgi:hypothetical protein
VVQAFDVGFHPPPAFPLESSLPSQTHPHNHTIKHHLSHPPLCPQGRDVPLTTTRRKKNYYPYPRMGKAKKSESLRHFQLTVCCRIRALVCQLASRMLFCAISSVAVSLGAFDVLFGSSISFMWLSWHRSRGSYCRRLGTISQFAVTCLYFLSTLSIISFVLWLFLYRLSGSLLIPA